MWYEQAVVRRDPSSEMKSDEIPAAAATAGPEWWKPHLSTPGQRVARGQRNSEAFPFKAGV